MRTDRLPTLRVSVAATRCQYWGGVGIPGPKFRVGVGIHTYISRMHSSRMHTARSSSHLLGGVYLGACWDTPPLGVGLETPSPSVDLETPWVGAWRPLQPDPSTSPPGCGSGDPHLARPLNLPLWCGPGYLQGMLGYHPRVNRMTGAKILPCPKLSLRAVIKTT